MSGTWVAVDESRFPPSCRPRRQDEQTYGRSVERVSNRIVSYIPLLQLRWVTSEELDEPRSFALK